jgi:hypothetical protein
MGWRTHTHHSLDFTDILKKVKGFHGGSCPYFLLVRMVIRVSLASTRLIFVKQSIFTCAHMFVKERNVENNVPFRICAVELLDALSARGLNKSRKWGNRGI